MFDPTSRYARLAVLTFTTPALTPIAYVSRRFLPRPETLPLLGETAARSDDRPDLIAARTLGDPTAFWRVADANLVMDPAEMVESPGRVLRIPVPQP
jgi:hypothetical protein